eukprot:scaffold4810_cov112-Isochrysis_galbana.AAC.3
MILVQKQETGVAGHQQRSLPLRALAAIAALAATVAPAKASTAHQCKRHRAGALAAAVLRLRRDTP